jgi:hypothetical protein
MQEELIIASKLSLHWLDYLQAFPPAAKINIYNDVNATLALA